MKQRCLNPNDPRYHDYGGRGIKIHPPWLVYENFLRDVGKAPENKSIDRFPDPNGNYEPGNVRWATAKEQQNNMRTNVRITFQGVTRTLSQWADYLGMARVCLDARRRKGWSVERMLTEPVTPKEPRPHCRRGHAMTPDNVYVRPDNGKRWCKTCRVERDRIGRGWEPEEAKNVPVGSVTYLRNGRGQYYAVSR